MRTPVPGRQSASGSPDGRQEKSGRIKLRDGRPEQGTARAPEFSPWSFWLRKIRNLLHLSLCASPGLWPLSQLWGGRYRPGSAFAWFCPAL